MGIASKVTTMYDMFYGCSNLTGIDLSSFDTSKVDIMTNMFSDCNKLTSLNLSNFDDSKATGMVKMFYKCESLEFLDITNFKTKSVEKMNQMFDGCKSLISLDISHFDTSSVINMNNMFNNCKSLELLNLTNFNTNNVKDMSYMFSNCTSLKSLNLESFNTSKVNNMKNFLSNCNSLLSLNINNFDASSITDISDMSNIFFNCSSLQILDFISYNTTYNSKFYEKILEGINPKLIYCLNINHNNMNNSYNCSGMCQSNIRGYEYNNSCYKSCPIRTNILSDINYLCEDLKCENKGKYYNFNQNECIDNITEGFYLNDTELKTIDKCHNDCRICQKKESERSTNCDSCLNATKYLFMGNCLNFCDYGIFYDSNNNKVCYCSNLKCKECSLESLDKNLCISCNIEKNYYPILNDSFKEPFIDCFNESMKSDGYFLNKESKYYEKCYKTCKNCFGFGNDIYHNCSECNSNYKFMKDFNCYENYSHYYYLGSDNKYYSTSSYICPENYRLIKEKNLCINNCTNDDEYKFEFNNRCYKGLEYIEQYNESESYNEKESRGDITDIPEGYLLGTNNIDKTSYLSEEIINKSKFDCMPSDYFSGNCKIISNKTSNTSYNYNNNTAEAIDEMINNIEKEIMNGGMDELISKILLNEKNDLLINEDNTLFQITSKENQKIIKIIIYPQLF